MEIAQCTDIYRYSDKEHIYKLINESRETIFMQKSLLTKAILDSEITVSNLMFKDGDLVFKTNNIKSKTNLNVKAITLGIIDLKFEMLFRSMSTNELEEYCYNYKYYENEKYRLYIEDLYKLVNETIQMDRKTFNKYILYNVSALLGESCALHNRDEYFTEFAENEGYDVWLTFDKDDLTKNSSEDNMALAAAIVYIYPHGLIELVDKIQSFLIKLNYEIISNDIGLKINYLDLSLMDFCKHSVLYLAYIAFKYGGLELEDIFKYCEEQSYDNYSSDYDKYKHDFCIRAGLQLEKGLTYGLDAMDKIIKYFNKNNITSSEIEIYANWFNKYNLNILKKSVPVIKYILKETKILGWNSAHIPCRYELDDNTESKLQLIRRVSSDSVNFIHLNVYSIDNSDNFLIEVQKSDKNEKNKVSLIKQIISNREDIEKLKRKILKLKVLGMIS